MRWPSWIDELKVRFLADTDSVFVVHGAVDDPLWDLDGTAVDAANILHEFLVATRTVVGVVGSDGLAFPRSSDRLRYERVLRTARAVTGDSTKHRVQGPSGALAQVWLAMASSGTPQGYIVREVELLASANEPPCRPPGFPSWHRIARHPRVRSANHVLVFLTKDIEEVADELVESAGIIELGLPEAQDASWATAADDGDLDDPEITMEAVLPERDQPTEEVPSEVLLAPKRSSPPKSDVGADDQMVSQAPESLSVSNPNRLERMQIVFALRVARQITEADGVLHLNELDMLVRVFPDEVLQRAGFLGEFGELNAAADAAFDTALVELRSAMSAQQKAQLIRWLYLACKVDGTVHPKERDVVVWAASALGLEPRALASLLR